MANQKYHYYIGVQNKDGMSFVTKIDNVNKTSYWDTDDEPPLEMGKTVAQDISWGLCLNGFNAVVVQSLFEIKQHFVCS